MRTAFHHILCHNVIRYCAYTTEPKRVQWLASYGPEKVICRLFFFFTLHTSFRSLDREVSLVSDTVHSEQGESAA